MTTLVFALSVALTAVLTALVCLLVSRRKKPTQAKKQPTQRDKRPRKTSNTVLIVLGLFILAFIVTMIVTYWRFQSVPDVLIQYTLGAGGIETVALAAIKISKTFKGGNTHE